MAKSLQDRVLDTLRKGKVPCTIIIINGFQIQNAIIVGFDNFSIWVDADGKQSLLFKHAISSISPNTTIALAKEEQNEGRQE